MPSSEVPSDHIPLSAGIVRNGAGSRKRAFKTASESAHKLAVQFALQGGPEKWRRERSYRRLPYRPDRARKARLRLVRALYERLGSISAAARALGVSRARVGLLLQNGVRYGIATAYPERPPFRSKGRFLTALGRHGSLRALARATNASPAAVSRSRRLCGITDSELAAARRAFRRRRESRAEGAA